MTNSITSLAGKVSQHRAESKSQGAVVWCNNKRELLDGYGKGRGRRHEIDLLTKWGDIKGVDSTATDRLVEVQELSAGQLTANRRFFRIEG